MQGYDVARRRVRMATPFRRKGRSLVALGYGRTIDLFGRSVRETHAPPLFTDGPAPSCALPPPDKPVAVRSALRARLAPPQEFLEQPVAILGRARRTPTRAHEAIEFLAI